MSGERAEPQGGRLDGCVVAVTRERPGELGELIGAEGGSVVHVPLIEIVEPVDGGAALADELGRLDDGDWLIVTSPAGAQRVGDAARHRPAVRLAAVGTATADRLARLAGRPVDLVPDRQLGAALAEEFVAANDTPRRVLLAVADRAATTISDRLVDEGHDVTSVVAYRTALRRPEPHEVERLATADAVVFTSGSAAESWADALGDTAASTLPPLAVAIGPSTAAAAARRGLKMTAVAADHSLAGVVDVLVRHWRSRTTSTDA